MGGIYNESDALERAEADAGVVADGRYRSDKTASEARQPPPLYPYQADVIGRVEAAIAGGKRRVLLEMPTGAGKTVVVAEMIRRALANGPRVLFIAHRRELIRQASEKLYAAGVDHGIVQAGFPTRSHEPVQVASIQTLHARAVRGTAMALPAADLLVIDEAHHATAGTYRGVIERYTDSILLGVTATPCRRDGAGLGSIFDILINGPSIAQLIANSYLVRPRVYAPSRPDLSGVPVERGDYVEAQLAKVMDADTLVGDVVTHWLRLAQGRPTVVFATGVAHSRHLADEFRRTGVLAEHLDGETPAAERDAILAQLADGRIDVVCNAMVLTEGWDCPEVSCLILARPTKSLGLYRQMAGRVLRRSPGKINALILDHAGAVFMHGLPDDPVEWTLSQDENARNRAQARRECGDAPGLTQCPECHAVKLAGRPCDMCGWRPRAKATAPEVIDGDLAEVGRDRQAAALIFDDAEWRRWYAELLWIATERDYKPGWAGHKYREKFGHWPPYENVTPATPSAEVRAWVRFRQIAYAKAMEKQRGAT